MLEKLYSITKDIRFLFVFVALLVLFAFITYPQIKDDSHNSTGFFSLKNDFNTNKLPDFNNADSNQVFEQYGYIPVSFNTDLN